MCTQRKRLWENWVSAQNSFSVPASVNKKCKQQAVKVVPCQRLISPKNKPVPRQLYDVSTPLLPAFSPFDIAVSPIVPVSDDSTDCDGASSIETMRDAGVEQDYEGFDGAEAKSVIKSTEETKKASFSSSSSGVDAINLLSDHEVPVPSCVLPVAMEEDSSICPLAHHLDYLTQPFNCVIQVRYLSTRSKDFIEAAPVAEQFCRQTCSVAFSSELEVELLVWIPA